MKVAAADESAADCVASLVTRLLLVRRLPVVLLVLTLMLLLLVLLVLSLVPLVPVLVLVLLPVQVLVLLLVEVQQQHPMTLGSLTLNPTSQPACLSSGALAPGCCCC